MKVNLRYRSYGVHELVDSIDIDDNFSDYCTQTSEDNYKIDEQKLIDNLPDGFLPVKPRNVLLTIGNDIGSTGQWINLNLFRPWAKYFDCYVIELMQD
jgi:hypothetical protein